MVIIPLFKRLSLIVRVNVVLNRTVVVDSDWRFDKLCGSHLQSQSELYQVSWWYYTLTSGPVTTATITYIRGTSETIARILQPYNIRVAHKPITTLRRLLTNAKDKDKPEDWQGAVYKIKCCDCQASYIGETGRNLSTRLTEHKRATRNGDVSNHIAEHHLKTKHQIDWDSATCITYSTDYYQRLTLESWFTNLEQTPLNRSQQLPAPYKRLIDEIKQNW